MPSSGTNNIIQELSRPSTLPLNPSIVPAISEWHIMMLALKLESSTCRGEPHKNKNIPLFNLELN
jgi:hypothetical protein